MPHITIAAERPDTADARTLIDELEAHLAPQYPPQSRHGYSIEKLLRERVVFFVLRQDEVPVGCGGIQLVGADPPRRSEPYGELKRMYVRPQFRGQGLGGILLNHLVEYARQQNVYVLRLETGIYQTAAIRLYERWGFQRIPPFGPYKEDPLSLFFEKRIVVDSTLWTQRRSRIRRE